MSCPRKPERFLKRIQHMVQDECKKQRIEQKDYRFSRREIREFTGWTDNQLKVHCLRLTELEYLLIHSGHRGKSLQYELLYDNGDDENQVHLMGLIDSKKLKNKRYDESKLDLSKTKLEPSCAQAG